MSVLVPGETCWRVERAERFACIVDAADYFHHAKTAMLRARHRIVLIGWDFDTRMTFERGGKRIAGPNQLGAFLRWISRRRPDLEVHVLKSNLNMFPALQGIWQGMTPVVVKNWLSKERLQFAIDGAHPTGSVHHQKVLVIDDAIAFCGGIDLTLDRWDTPDHEHNSRFRRALGRNYGPRHEVAVAVDGDAARALGELARDRWRAATGRRLEPVHAAHTAWPRSLHPTLTDIDVGIARTLPALENQTEVREVEALNLEAIAAARDTIYLENQYLASRTLVEALAARLREAEGPDVVVVMPRQSESRLEQTAMDSARQRLLHVLWSADEHGRFGIYWPVTDGGSPVYVHSKVMVIDDRLLRVGSSNLNNRSMGFDSECDVAIEAGAEAADGSGQDDVRATIVAVRHRLISEHLGVSAGEFERTLARRGSFLQAVEELRGHGRTLRVFTEETVAGEAGPLAENDLMDPDRVPASLTRSVQRFLTGLRGE
ncbi:phospholipase D-like domain-containing protein [Mycolicibacterium arseniciresistens]|uniref:Phospholipase D-like domain-containing protein n=1 Tax=Mycolicibacterium arseniciresistens TaxID=3062257 RepID=A0ABT8UJA5_9MYCO|nr:phospholipase D-like domain-containing protein [Mycolicibacterium arseniciresistens]MDO3637882.1 phospholipase D-like domain-containing protein [Mycolicibacterium arseniciresistens]